ncbi:MAG: pro-sigmaK processing inhibitor BofA family protein [Ruminococcus sp.]|nr:pro-sigmaK processing inhibitor BofA family protein [Ruminococcus sp.]
MTEGQIFWLAWCILGIGMLVYYLRRQHPIRSLFVGVCSGFAALLLVHFGGSLLGLHFPLNALHVVQATILGIPGVILMVVLHFIL